MKQNLKRHTTGPELEMEIPRPQGPRGPFSAVSQPHFYLSHTSGLLQLQGYYPLDPGEDPMDLCRAHLHSIVLLGEEGFGVQGEEEATKEPHGWACALTLAGHST